MCSAVGYGWAAVLCASAVLIAASAVTLLVSTFRVSGRHGGGDDET